jgi:hypothetical protein
MQSGGGCNDIMISDVALSLNASFPPPLLQFFQQPLLRFYSDAALVQASRSTQLYIPPRAQSVKEKLRAELEEAQERERQLLLSQGECSDDEEDMSASLEKIFIVEEQPWQKFIECNFGPGAQQDSRDRARAAATHIQRMLRGFLVNCSHRAVAAVVASRCCCCRCICCSITKLRFENRVPRGLFYSESGTNFKK